MFPNVSVQCVKLRPFDIIMPYNIVVWALRMEHGGALTTIDALLVSIRSAHTMLPYNTRISNSLSFNQSIFQPARQEEILFTFKVLGCTECLAYRITGKTKKLHCFAIRYKINIELRNGLLFTH